MTGAITDDASVMGEGMAEPVSPPSEGGMSGTGVVGLEGGAGVTGIRGGGGVGSAGVTDAVL